MMTIGTLLVYVMVAVCVLYTRYLNTKLVKHFRYIVLGLNDNTILSMLLSCKNFYNRYQEQSDFDYDILADEYIESTALVTIKVQYTKRQILKQLFNFHKFVRANSLSSYVASLQTTCFSKQNHPKISKTIFTSTGHNKKM